MFFAGLFDSSHFVGMQAAASSLKSISYVSNKPGGVSSFMRTSIVE